MCACVCRSEGKRWNRVPPSSPRGTSGMELRFSGLAVSKHFHKPNHLEPPAFLTLVLSRNLTSSCLSLLSQQARLDGKDF